MGFYGNITNTARTQFQFDRVFPNRFTMDQSASSDGIYPGRYVLVNYEELGNYDYYVHAFKSIDMVYDAEQEQEVPIVVLGSSVNEEELVRFKYVETKAEADQNTAELVYKGQVLAIPPDHIHNLVDPTKTKWEFWKVVGKRPQEISTTEGGTTIVLYPVYEEYTDDFSTNYNIDVDAYGTSRGYDSTVWQKVYQNGEDKYVMVAELNTVVPTFDIEADAPKMVPLTPHFDADSTNVYYKLHWPTAWGFRVKSAKPNLMGPLLNEYGETTEVGLTRMSSDRTNYPSDETTNWYKTSYDGVNTTKDYVFTVDSRGQQGKWIPLNTEERIQNEGVPESVIEPAAAIYYNKAGFNPQKISYGYFRINLNEETYQPSIYYEKIDGKYVLSTSFYYNPETVYYEKIEDHIRLEPTGLSGHMYNKHDGSITKSAQVDTQEISIMLPAIGNTISAVWDLIYGGENINPNGKRNLDVSWERAQSDMSRHGLRLVNEYNFDDTYIYQTQNIETVAGAINSVHDLMGMIITPAPHDILTDNMNSLDENRIYYDETLKTFNRKCKQYTYVPVGSNKYLYDEINITDEDYEPGIYFYEDNSEEYIVDNNTNFTEGRTYYLRRINKDAEYEEIDDLVPFDGSIYAYKDFLGVDSLASDLKRANFVRDPKYYKDKTYYRWDQIIKSANINLADNYEPNVFYYLDNLGNYLIAQEQYPSTLKTYFSIRPENIQSLEDISTNSTPIDGVYVPGKYLYQDSPNHFAIDTRPQMSDVVYYLPDSDSSSVQIGNNTYSKEVSYIEANINEQNYVPDVYYLRKDPYVNNVGQDNNPDHYEDEPCSDAQYDANKKYYIRQETLTLVNGSSFYTVNLNEPLNLIQFHDYEFYTKDEYNNYYVITRISNFPELMSDIYVLRKNTNRLEGESNGGTYKLSGTDFTNEAVSGMIIHDQFYEGGQYHYETTDSEDYSNYVLDTYPTKTPGRDYFTLTAVGNPITNITFFDSHEYYQKNNADEYVLITTNTIPENTTIYKRKPLYVINDTADIYSRGAIWDFNTDYVPASITLGNQVESYGLEPLEDFARNINTMHGMLLKIRSILSYTDKDTRDLRTVQGAINTLNDKIAQFATWKPGEVLLVDDYGRLHSAQRIGTKWTTINVDSRISTPKIWITHEWTQIPDTSHTTNLKTDNNASLINSYPLIDETGHVGGFHTETYQLPEAYGIITGDSGSLAAGGTHASIKLEGTDQWIQTEVDSSNRKVKFTHEYNPIDNTSGTTNLNTNNNAQYVDVSALIDATGHVVGTHSETIKFPHGYGIFKDDSDNSLVAGGTYATVKFEGTDNWIQTSVATEDNVKKVKITHEYHAGTSSTASVNLSTNTDAQIIDKEPILDDKGHVVAWKTTTYDMPDGYGFITTATGTALAAGSPYATLHFNGADNWIKAETAIISGTNTVQITHENPVTTGATARGETGNKTPAFGDTFKVPSFSIDDKGHIAISADHTVTIPNISLTTGTNSTTNSVITNLTYSNGAFTKTSLAPNSLVLTGYTTPSGVTANIAATDTIGQAFGKLESQIANLDLTEVSAESGEVISKVSQLNGQISVSKKNLITETFTYNTNKTTSVATMAGAIDTINSNIADLDLTEVSAGSGYVIDKISQTNGKVSATTKQLQAADIPDISDNSFDYTPTGESVAQSFTLKDIVQRLIDLEATVEALGE